MQIFAKHLLFLFVCSELQIKAVNINVVHLHLVVLNNHELKMFLREMTEYPDLLQRRERS